MATKRQASFSCHADPMAVRDVLQEMSDCLHGWSVPSDPRVELAVAEAMNNIVEHAYAENPSGRIKIAIESEPKGLTVNLRDRGTPMPAETLPDGHLPAPETLPEGGWGWSLIHACCDTLHYQRDQDTNALTMVFHQVEI